MVQVCQILLWNTASYLLVGQDTGTSRSCAVLLPHGKIWSPGGPGCWDIKILCCAAAPWENLVSRWARMLGHQDLVLCCCPMGRSSLQVGQDAGTSRSCAVLLPHGRLVSRWARILGHQDLVLCCCPMGRSSLQVGQDAGTSRSCAVLLPHGRIWSPGGPGYWDIKILCCAAAPWEDLVSRWARILGHQDLVLCCCPVGGSGLQVGQDTGTSRSCAVLLPHGRLVSRWARILGHQDLVLCCCPMGRSGLQVGQDAGTSRSCAVLLPHGKI